MGPHNGGRYLEIVVSSGLTVNNYDNESVI